MTWVWIFLVAAVACSVNAGRIVGGDSTTIEEYPSIVQLERYRSGVWGQSCAANILNSIFILSVAHCFSDDPAVVADLRRIRAGTTYRNSGGVIHTLFEVILHENYGVEAILDADIALARLNEPLVFSDVIGSVAIPPQGFDLSGGLDVVHAGWGTTTQGGTSSPTLRDVTIQTVSRELCAERYYNRPIVPAVVTENMICAGVLDVGGKDACQGDSGGPLYYSGILVGLVSWGEGCANAHYPGVSTRVSSYTDWILSKAV